jgi:hypothetical protein
MERKMKKKKLRLEDRKVMGQLRTETEKDKGQR